VTNNLGTLTQKELFCMPETVLVYATGNANERKNNNLLSFSLFWRQKHPELFFFDVKLLKTHGLMFFLQQKFFC
jgi:hypothetical protein